MHRRVSCKVADMKMYTHTHHTMPCIQPVASMSGKYNSSSDNNNVNKNDSTVKGFPEHEW